MSEPVADQAPGRFAPEHGGWRREELDNLAKMQIAFATGGLLVASGAQMFWRQPLSAFAYTMTGAFLALTLYAGKQLYAGTDLGLGLSWAVQLLQVVHLNTTAMAHFALAGPTIELGLSSKVVRLTVGAGALVSFAPMTASAQALPGTWVEGHLGFLLQAGAGDARPTIGINLVATAMALRLWQERSRRQASRLTRA